MFINPPDNNRIARLRQTYLVGLQGGTINDNVEPKKPYKFELRKNEAFEAFAPYALSVVTNSR